MLFTGCEVRKWQKTEPKFEAEGTNFRVIFYFEFIEHIKHNKIQQM